MLLGRVAGQLEDVAVDGRAVAPITGEHGPCPAWAGNRVRFGPITEDGIVLAPTAMSSHTTDRPGVGVGDEIRLQPSIRQWLRARKSILRSCHIRLTRGPRFGTLDGLLAAVPRPPQPAHTIGCGLVHFRLIVQVGVATVVIAWHKTWPRTGIDHTRARGKRAVGLFDGHGEAASGDRRVLASAHAFPLVGYPVPA